MSEWTIPGSGSRPIYCPRCGTAHYEVGGAFCSRCGGRLPEPPRDYVGYGPPPAPPFAEVPRRLHREIVALITAAAVVLVAAGVTAFLMWRHADSGSGPRQLAAAPRTPTNVAANPAPARAPAKSVAAPTSSPKPAVLRRREMRREAVAVNSLLNQSSVDRGLLGPALSEVTGCHDVYGGEMTISRVAADRRQELAQLDALDTHALPARTISELAAALSYSARSDGEFAAWARDVESYYGCDSSYMPKDSHYTNGQVFSGRATQAKTTFVRLWNRLAVRFGLPYRAADTI